ncbi:5154_t:CDS:1, partial [Gigaspora margarita]
MSTEHMEWATTVLEKRKRPDTLVDLQTWSYDSIAKALTNMKGINKFTSHILSATPTCLSIPEAIWL